ncbi:MAG: hypothetical protein FWF02_07245 [Micrococcales bacterium]|nr:hypothetical protein [Micrococcales bacterium]MCL2667487.1 hypothetical protein [Micrococcales bacterium]
MKSTSAFVVGVGVGLLLGTKAGREKLDQLKDWATDAWQDPRVQEHVAGASEKAKTYVAEQSAALRDQVNATLHPEES